MEHKKKNQTLSDKLEATNNHLKSFVEGLKSLLKEVSEQEYELYLEEQVLPAFLDEDVRYGSIWNKMDVVKIVQIDSILEERGESFEQAIHHMNEGAMCWILEHIWAMNEVLKENDPYEKGDEKERDKRFERLERNIKQLQAWVNGDMFERIQNYTYELKKVQEVGA